MHSDERESTVPENPPLSAEPETSPDEARPRARKTARKSTRKRPAREVGDQESPSQTPLFSTDGEGSSNLPRGLDLEEDTPPSHEPAERESRPAVTHNGTRGDQPGSSDGRRPSGEGRRDQDGGSPRDDRKRHRENPGGHEQRNAEMSKNQRKKKNKQRNRGGGGGGGGERATLNQGPRLRSDGIPVETDSSFEPGDLPQDEKLQSLEGIAFYASEIVDTDRAPLAFDEIYNSEYPDLLARFESLGLKLEYAPSRPRLLAAILDHARSERQPIRISGTVDLYDDGFGLLLFLSDNFRVRPLSVFLPEPLLDSQGIRRGHDIEVLAVPPRPGESCPVAYAIQSVMGRSYEEVEHQTPFTELVPYYPLDRILLERPDLEKGWDNLSMRIVDLITPVGYGQRGLIVAPPRTGKTVLLQNIANSIRKNSPGTHLMILLVDERPEEVTDFKRRVDTEVISSTFDESAESHVHAAEMVIERARCMVEDGRNVVILLDSITRLARAYNTMMPNSGKILSGGVEANALQKPKRFFGSARNIEGGGSLTILGTALVETGSKMDEVIFEEFKGTGNMELHLDRELANKRIFPALSMDRSGTRKEELLYHPDEMNKVYSLRRAMRGIPPTDAMENLITRVKKTGTNAEFLMSLGR